MSDLTSCIRCGAPCRVSGPGKDEAEVLRLSATPDGFCANCAITQYVQVDYHFGPRGQGGLIDRFDADPSILLMPHVREMFSNLLDIGRSDANPAEIDWQRVVDNWTLPFPRKGRKPKSKPVEQGSLL